MSEFFFTLGMRKISKSKSNKRIYFNIFDYIKKFKKMFWYG